MRRPMNLADLNYFFAQLKIPPRILQAPTRIRKSLPRVNDRMWLEARRDVGKQPNGYITDVVYHYKFVTVFFHDDEYDDLVFDALHGNWTDYYGGCYVIYTVREG